MKNLILSKLKIFIAALWWGSLTTLGFFVVPMLFQHLPTKGLAGNMAARLFEVQTWVSVGCCLILLLVSSARNTKNELNAAESGVLIARAAIILIVLGMLLSLLVAFGVSPRIVARENLMLWHTVGSLMYLAQWVCAGLVLWKLSNTKSVT